MAESFHVNLEEYQGPFDVLLSLVSQRQLELTQISLSAVTEEFVAYIKQLDMRDNADQVSSFIDVASILIEAKSAQLIPREQADEDFEAHLEALQQRDLLFCYSIAPSKQQVRSSVAALPLIQNASLIRER